MPNVKVNDIYEYERKIIITKSTMNIRISGFSIDDIQKAKEFHRPTLRLEAKQDV